MLADMASMTGSIRKLNESCHFLDQAVLLQGH